MGVNYGAESGHGLTSKGTLPPCSVRRFSAVRVFDIEEKLEVEAGSHLVASGKQLIAVFTK